MTLRLTCLKGRVAIIPDTAWAWRRVVEYSVGFQTDRAIQRSDAFEMGTKVKDSLCSKLYPQQ